MCTCADNPKDIMHFAGIAGATTGLYWGYQHINKSIKIKPWMPPINGECDRCVAIRDAQQPGAMVDAVFPVARAHNQTQYYKWIQYVFFEHRLDVDARFAALLEEC